MSRKTINYGKYFSPAQQAKIIIRPSDGNFIDRNAEIISVDSDQVWLELLGEGIRENGLAGNAGIKVSLSSSSGWGLFRCNGVLSNVVDGKKIGVRLTGQVEEQQRREYFRLDVDVPLQYTVPADQHIASVTRELNEKRKKLVSVVPVISSFEMGYKVNRWLGGEDLLPSNVNLSGGGLRIKTTQHMEAGTRVLVDIFLPMAPVRIISAVAEVVRCNEIQLSWQKGTSFTTAMKFTNIDEKDRESIISFVFCEQRNQLKASLEKKA